MKNERYALKNESTPPPHHLNKAKPKKRSQRPFKHFELEWTFKKHCARSQG